MLSLSWVPRTAASCLRSWRLLSVEAVGAATGDLTFQEYFDLGTVKTDEIKGLPRPDLVQKVLAVEGMNRQEKTRHGVRQARKDFQRHDHDTGSTEVQAMLSYKIKALEWHMVRHRQDKSAPRIMQKLIHTRRKHLVYLRRRDFARYCTLIQRLELNDTYYKQVPREYPCML